MNPLNPTQAVDALIASLSAFVRLGQRSTDQRR
ncbi:MAG: hypothetical protein QOJ40_3140 [Verrucomicrobiota bacterium]